MNLGIKRMLFLLSTLQRSMIVRCRWLYSLFIAMDANFRLKLKTRGIKDPELGSGLAYFVNAPKFEAHLKNHIEEEEVSISNSVLLLDGELTPQELETCGTEFHAVNQANSKRSTDFTVSGVGAVVCRHGLVRKNGVVDLQKGERCVYVFKSYPFVFDQPCKICKHGLHLYINRERREGQDHQSFLRYRLPLVHQTVSEDPKLF